MITRRDALVGLGAGVGVAALSAGGYAWRLIRRVPAYQFGKTGDPVTGAATSELQCTAGTITVAEQEGPFYTPSTPERRDIRDPGVNTGLLVLGGRVVDTQCRPIAGAVLDFWQTGHDGLYDNQGYRYRGHQYTDAEGRFELVTVRPHAYTAMNIFRTPHIHVRVRGRETGLLTTQLYLPDAEDTNARDGGYLPTLAVTYAGQDGPARHATFDFVLPRA